MDEPKSVAAMCVASGRWSLGADGMPVNKKADPRCTMCRGHGVVEDGQFHYASVLIDCPRCIKNEDRS